MVRRFVVLALAAAAAATASGALATPPGGPQPDPESVLPVSPSLASLCQSPGSYPHPIAACSAVQVSCPSTARAQFACKTTGSVGQGNSDTRKLELVLPKRYSALTLLCTAKSGVDVACRVSRRTSTNSSGIRVSVVELPSSSSSVRIGCATGRTAFACRIKN